MHEDLSEATGPIYYELNRVASSTTHFLVRTSKNAPAQPAALRAAIENADPWLVVDAVTSMPALINRSDADRRLRAFLAGLYGISALALAALAVYAIASRLAHERRRECSLRLAIGASPSHIRRQMVGEVLRITGTGLIVGVPLAAMSVHVIRSFLFGVSNSGIQLLAGGAAAAVAVSVLASLGPANQVARANPADALKN